MEKAVDEPAHQAVARAVQGALVLGEVGGGEAVANHHVAGLRRQHLGAERGGVAGRVGVVAVDEQVAVGFHIAHHAAHHVALALARLSAYGGAGGAGHGGGGIGGAVVVDVDGGLGQGLTEVGHHLGYGSLFVVAGYENGDAGSTCHGNLG